MGVVWILSASVLLSVVAAFFALRLIFVTKVRGAWGLLAAAILLMAAHASTSLTGLLGGHELHPTDRVLAVVYLGIAALMMLGVWGVQPVFVSMEGSARALREERNMLTAILDTVGALVVVLDREARIVRFNRACEEATGYRADDVIGRRLWDFLLLPDEADSVREVFSALRESAIPSTHENHWVARNGEKRLISWSNTVLLGEDGGVEFVIGTGLDITDRKYMQRALAESLENYQSLVENATIGIYRTSLEGRFLQMNTAFARMLGYESPEELSDINIASLYVDTEERQQLIETLRGSDRIEGVEVRWWRKDRTMATFRLTGRCIYAESGKLESFEVFAEDVTEQKRLEQELMAAMRMEAVARLTGAIAHDFNNLLTVIGGNAALLDQMTAGDTPAKTHVIRIGQAADHARALVRQLLAFSRKREPDTRAVNLNAVLREMEPMIRWVLGPDIELLTKLEPDLWEVRGDPVKFQQVIMNLAVNARDAMPGRGTFTIETRNVALVESLDRLGPEMIPGPRVLLTVTDTGCGMDEETVDQIFEPFFSTKGPDKGTGLGLWTTHEIVKQSGGRISVRSEPGKGTTFEIDLPSVVAIEPERETPPRQEPIARGSERVLLVEDEEGIRTLVSEVLESHGYSVLEAEDSGKALAIAKSHPEPIDLLLTDLVMPVLGGRDLAMHLRSLWPSLRVLYISGGPENAAFLDGQGRAGESFLLKPFQPGDLARKVREVLDQPVS